MAEVTMNRENKLSNYGDDIGLMRTSRDIYPF
jgi:hypothetical protein